MAQKKGTKSTSKSKANNDANIATVAALAGAAVAAVVGGVYFYGKEGKKRRTELKSWMVKAKGDVMDKIEKTKELGEEDYQKLVDTVLSKYKKLKDVKNTEIDALAKDLKSGWKEISATVKKTSKTVKKNTKSAVKKATPKKKASTTKRKTTKSSKK